MVDTSGQPRRTVRPSEVVDSHVHLLDPAVLPYPWVRGTALDRAFTPQDLDAVGADLDAMVVVQADTSADRAVDEVRWVSRVCEGRADLLGVVAFAPLERGAAVGADLDALTAAGPVVGVRRLLQDEPDGFTRSRSFDAGLAELTSRDLPFDLCVRHHQLDEVLDLVHRHPLQRFVLDHLGKPVVGDAAVLASWSDSVRRLAEHPGVVVKLSGLALELAPGAPLGAARDHLDLALEVFGPSRCLYGSDWPVLTLRTDYAAWRALVESAVEHLGARDRAEVMGGTARRVYRLRPSAPGGEHLGRSGTPGRG